MNTKRIINEIGLALIANLIRNSFPSELLEVRIPRIDIIIDQFELTRIEITMTRRLRYKSE